MSETLDGGQIGMGITNPVGIPTRDKVVKYSETGEGLYRTFKEILNLPTFLNSGTIDSTAKLNDIIYEIELSPNALKSDIAISRVYYLAQLFKFWKGDIHFEMISTKAIFQQTKFIFAFFPGATKADSESITLADCVAQQHHVIFNPDNDNMVSINIPFWSTKTKHLLSEPTGLFTIRVFQPIVVTQETVTPLQWTLLVKSDSMDFYFAKTPGSALDTPQFANGVALGSVSGAQAPGDTESQAVPVVATSVSTNTIQSQAFVPKTIMTKLKDDQALATNLVGNRPLDSEPISTFNLDETEIINDIFGTQAYVKANALEGISANEFFHSSSLQNVYCNINTSQAYQSTTIVNLGEGILTFADLSDLNTLISHKIAAAQITYVPSTKENLLTITCPADETIPNAAHQIKTLTFVGRADNAAVGNKVKADIQQLIDDPTVTHMSVYSPQPAAILNSELADYATGGPVPKDLIAQHGTTFGANQDGRASELVDQRERYDVSDFGFLGPIFDLVSNLPFIGDVIKPIASIVEGIVPALLSVRADDVFVFDVAPGGNKVQYKYNSEATKMDINARRAYFRQRAVQYNNQNRAMLRQMKINHQMDFMVRMDQKKKQIKQLINVGFVHHVPLTEEEQWKIFQDQVDEENKKQAQRRQNQIPARDYPYAFAYAEVLVNKPPFSTFDVTD